MAITNIAEHLIHRSQLSPHLPSVICALGQNRQGRRGYTIQTYAQLNRESAQIAFWLKTIGVKKGAKAILMVKPGPDLFALTFGLFKAGIVPILIDPGMDKSDLKGCIAAAAPDVFIGIPIAHLARQLLGWGKATVTHTIVVGGTEVGWRSAMEKPIARLLGQKHLREAYQVTPQVADDYVDQTDPNSMAAILYTSGSTGTPKGAMYRHRHFIAQVELLQSTYHFREGAFDVPTFPLFALFDPALGMSAVFPIMDYSAPAKANPEEIFAVIEDFGAENLFCSPALLCRLSNALKQTPRALPTLKRVISAGAPVPVEEMKTIKQAAHETAEIYTPYGATESLPLSSISCSEVIERGYRGQRSGRGVCVGLPTAGVSIKIIKVTDQVISSWDEVELIEVTMPSDRSITPKNTAEHIGEIVVYGPSTTQSYIAHPKGNALSKIKGVPPGIQAIDSQDFSHRMGDLGYFDEDGFLWICGRKSHRIDTEVDGQLQRWLPHCIEGPLNQIEGIFRTALVRSDRGPIICVELSPNQSVPHILNTLKTQIKAHSSMKGIYGVIQHPDFPVDTRHNAKIKREKIARWVSTRLNQVDPL